MLPFSTQGYQFWTQCDSLGYFKISNIRAGNYSLYAWVPGFIGDYKYSYEIEVKPGFKQQLLLLLSQTIHIYY